MNFQVKDFKCSTKNIPLASRNTFLQQLINKTESLIHRMRWRAFFFLKDQDADDTSKETYGFKSKRPPPHINELTEFKDCMLDMIQRVEFRTNHKPNDLHKKLENDLREIRQDSNIFVKADKTTNHYKTKPGDYLTLVKKNVTKAYKKTSQNVPSNITSADKRIAQDLSLDDRIETSAKRDTFATLKDHKPDFINNPSCRLINPSKSEIGIISKKIQDNINKKVIAATKVNLWKSTTQAIKWFQNLPTNTPLAFITFDVCEFYPSISEQLLTKALDYATQFTAITPEDRHIILHAKKSLLYYSNSPWEKKKTKDQFDVTMGSYDGAETCDLIGAYMLSLIAPKLKEGVGLYRDDGLAVCSASPQKIEKTKQEICKVFKANNLSITIEANKKIVNFLDVTWDLTNRSFKPFMKPNKKILYVHHQSNHPLALLKNIPENINKRLSSISSTQQVFKGAIPPYQKALDESRYNFKLTFHPPNNRTNTQNRKRARHITWYNPPWNSRVKTNLGRKFLFIVDKCFLKKHPLHKMFNRHTLKLSYSCMPNIKSIIASHNKTVLSNYTSTPATEHVKECNCSKKEQCPLDGQCLTNNIVYQAIVTTNTTTETYVGLATNFKELYRNHTSSFRNHKKKNDTELSKYIWTLKNANKPFNIKWRILKKCQPYNNISKKCNLCLSEKFFIICKKELWSLNKRNELASSCHHRNRFLLKNFMPT